MKEDGYVARQHISPRLLGGKAAKTLSVYPLERVEGMDGMLYPPCALRPDWKKDGVITKM